MARRRSNSRNEDCAEAGGTAIRHVELPGAVRVNIREHLSDSAKKMKLTSNLLEPVTAYVLLNMVNSDGTTWISLCRFLDYSPAWVRNWRNSMAQGVAHSASERTLLKLRTEILEPYEDLIEDVVAVEPIEDAEEQAGGHGFVPMDDERPRQLEEMQGAQGDEGVVEVSSS